MDYPLNENGLKKSLRPIKSHYPIKSHNDKGYTLLGLIIIIAILGIMLLSVGEVWHFARKREKEQELLFVGDQFRRAIKLYYGHTPVSHKQQPYPMALEELLKDPRYPTTFRYLRKIYSDPVRGVPEWGILRNPSGGIIGIYSLSEETPAKLGGFRLEEQEFEGTTKYSDWSFKYIPQ